MHEVALARCKKKRVLSQKSEEEKERKSEDIKYKREERTKMGECVISAADAFAAATEGNATAAGGGGTKTHKKNEKKDRIKDLWITLL